MTTARSKRAVSWTRSRTRRAGEQPAREGTTTAPDEASDEERAEVAGANTATAVQAPGSNGTYAPARPANRPSAVGHVETGPFVVGAPGEPLRQSRHYLWTKRGIDVVGAAALLIVLAPVIGVLAVLIKLTSPGPVIFRQKRIGLHEQPFEVLKFRSMVVDAEDRLPELMALKETNAIQVADAPAFKSPDDPRVTVAGRVMRTYSLDEIPQLWNVCMGSMSLVGPRPLVPAEADTLPDWARGRHAAKPGITCTWQISGRSEVTYEQRLAMDMEYTRTASLRQDLSILLRTPLAVITARGAY